VVTDGQWLAGIEAKSWICTFEVVKELVTLPSSARYTLPARDRKV